MESKPENNTEARFISVISHKLRTPLNSIIGFSDLLLDQIYGEINEKQAHYLDNIHSSGRHLLSLLNDVIDLMNLKWGDTRLDYKDFSLSQAINDAQMSINIFADKKNISLEIRYDEQVSTIRADNGKFTEILRHLLSNAVKFTPSGGRVEITTRYLDAPPSHFSSLPAQPFLEISVADNGIGINEEYHEKIFSEFSQHRSDISQEFEGTGLGLTLSRNLVRLHHGEIWVESEEGKGAKFSFIIPILGPEALEEEHGRKKILLVDDTLLNRELAKDILELAGFQVIEAVNGREAIDNACQSKPDIILLDIELPDINGFEVIKLLKEDPLTRDIGVVALTVHGQDIARERFLAEGFKGYIAKPIDTKKFPKMVTEYLD